MIEIAHLPKYNNAIPLALLLVCLGFGLLFMSGGVSAQGTAPIPAAYYGSVTVDGEPAPAGVEVTAELAGTTYGPITTNADGEFGGPTPADQKLVVDPSEIPDNTEVVFFVEGQEVDTTASWESGNNEQVELSVAKLPGINDGSDDGDDSSDDSSGSSGGQTGGQSPADEAVESGTEATASSVEQVRSELTQTTPDREVSVELADADPDRPGLTVNPAQSGIVSQITFGNERATGTVEIREYQNYPESVSESISQAVSESRVTDDEGTDTGDIQAEASVVSIVDISPSDEQTLNSAATIRMTVDKNKLTNVNNAIILHERENSWEQLDITRRDTTGDEVVLEANVESFSLFTVAELSTPARNTTDSAADASSGGTDAADGGTSDGLNGFGIPVILATFLLVSLLIHRRSKHE